MTRVRPHRDRAHPTPIRSGLVTLVMALAAVAVAGCGTDSADFVREGEKYLESAEMTAAAGVQLVGARCDAPDSTAVGTVYTCTASDVRGYAWIFDVEITGPRELTVQDVRPDPRVNWGG